MLLCKQKQESYELNLNIQWFLFCKYDQLCYDWAWFYLPFIISSVWAFCCLTREYYLFDSWSVSATRLTSQISQSDMGPWYKAVIGTRQYHIHNMLNMIQSWHSMEQRKDAEELWNEHMIIDRKLISHLFPWSLHQNKPCVVWISSRWWIVYNWCFYVCVFCSVHGPLRVWQTCLLSVTASIVYNSHSQLTFITSAFNGKMSFPFHIHKTIFVQLKAFYIFY